MKWNLNSFWLDDSEVCDPKKSKWPEEKKSLEEQAFGWYLKHQGKTEKTRSHNQLQHLKVIIVQRPMQQQSLLLSLR